MATRGSTKWLSERQENRVAKTYGGVRSPSSGAAQTDQGDVRTRTDLIECKHAGTLDKPAKSIRLELADFEKIFDEAVSEGREAVMVLGIYAPDSVLADSDGEVNFTVRLMLDDFHGRVPFQVMT